MFGVFLLFLIAYVHSKRLPGIYWNSSNPIFDISNTDHVMNVEIDDRISIYCPKPAADGYEYSLIYMVSEDEYSSCELQKPHLIGSCGNNTRETSIGIVFRHFSPLPGGLEFQPGKSYYMTSTSDGTREGMDQQKDGLCKQKQMKIKFEVAHRGGPKFAARTLTRHDEFVPSTTPIMYIIHNSDSEPDDEDDDGSSFNGSYILILTSLLAFNF